MWFILAVFVVGLLLNMVGFGLIEPSVGDTDKETGSEPISKKDHNPLTKDIDHIEGFDIASSSVKS